MTLIADLPEHIFYKDITEVLCNFHVLAMTKQMY